MLCSDITHYEYHIEQTRESIALRAAQLQTSPQYQAPSTGVTSGYVLLGLTMVQALYGSGRGRCAGKVGQLLVAWARHLRRLPPRSFPHKLAPP